MPRASRRDLPGAARHQLGGHDDELRLAVEAVEPREEQLGGAPAERERILRDDRDAGLDHVRKRDVVEADERRSRAARPRSRSARIAPIVMRFCAAKSAVGGSGASSSSRAAASADVAVDEPDALERRLAADPGARRAPRDSRGGARPP